MTEPVNHAASGWIGVDLDGTLAEYDRWHGPEYIGAPIPAMVERVKGWIAAGYDVRIVTARVAALHTNTSSGREFLEALDAIKAIRAWCREHIGHDLIVTAVKDYGMIELWDDRAVSLRENTGIPALGQMSRVCELS